ncbi:MAG: dihydrodipicolinate synthase family protein, partial [Pirellulaceae bacterium]|nr:dihydrodipicolinate synthase family protein [Pirellulaceae bacterium]
MHEVLSLTELRSQLSQGLVIPACPLALDSARRFDERRQRALVRYYLDAGAGGLAVGVHTTQFAIREPRYGLFKPVLQLAAEEMKRRQPGAIRVGGICGLTGQAMAEAAFLVENGYHCGLLSLGALANASEDDLLKHCRQVAAEIPVVGFYLQPAVGGRVL